MRKPERPATGQRPRDGPELRDRTTVAADRDALAPCGAINELRKVLLGREEVDM